MKIILAVVTICFLLSGCATILHGSSDVVRFNSEPTGAKIYEEGALLGTAPLTVGMKSSKEHFVTYKMDGYQDATKKIDYHILGGYVVFDVLFGFVPLIIDAASGCWNGIENQNILVNLEKINK